MILTKEEEKKWLQKINTFELRWDEIKTETERNKKRFKQQKNKMKI